MIDVHQSIQFQHYYSIGVPETNERTNEFLLATIAFLLHVMVHLSCGTEFINGLVIYLVGWEYDFEF